MLPSPRLSATSAFIADNDAPYVEPLDMISELREDKTLAERLREAHETRRKRSRARSNASSGSRPAISASSRARGVNNEAYFVVVGVVILPNPRSRAAGEIVHPCTTSETITTPNVEPNKSAALREPASIGMIAR